jgi:hypothetical protein
VFERVTVTTPDLAAAEAGYAALIGSPQPWPDFALREAAEGEPHTENLHIAFRASSPEAVKHRWKAAMDAGFRDDGPPGPRPQYRDDYFGGFALDPGGNRAETVIHGGDHPPDRIDHLWIRVEDLASARVPFDEAAEPGGWILRRDDPDFVHYACPTGSFSLMPGMPTRNVRIAFAESQAIEL